MFSCRKKSKEKECPPSLTVSDTDEYSTVDLLPQTVLDRSLSSAAAAAVGSVTSDPKDDSLVMVDCDLYSQYADVLMSDPKRVQPDISPYACFYGAPKHQVLKVGWLDKLSPQG